MKIGILKERKSPPDFRVPVSPKQLKQLKNAFTNVTFMVESYANRAFSDAEYKANGIQVVKDVRQCDVLLGVKEVPVEFLWSDKTYFFFSHTIKEQHYNRELLKTVLQRNIRLIDYECIKENGERLIGFGKYAGNVGAYNALRAYGLRKGSFRLKPAHQCFDLKEVKSQLADYAYPPKIVMTGGGLVSQGAKEILKSAGYTELDKHSFVNNSQPLSFLCIDYDDYNVRKTDGSFSQSEFYEQPERYKNIFSKYLQLADCVIFGHYWAEGAPAFFKPNDLQDSNLRTKVIADISCDIAGPVPTTIRSSSIDKPLYGVDKMSLKETEPYANNSITVMAVDNLPCEVSRDASEGFGSILSKGIIPKYLVDPKNKIIADAIIAEHGKLTSKYTYLNDYVGI